uniref:Disease resistance R13L4/SHOC-2-like LRR domain-containing protein n=2 Tax=Quercus lobata TaxID=97700 RepID=A0A7N2R0N3_QUELO
MLKSKPSLEHHSVLESKPSLEHHPIPQSEPSLETTAVRPVITATATSGNSSPKAATKSEGNNSSEGRKEDRKIDDILEKIQNNLNQIKDSFIQLQKLEESSLAKQLKNCLGNLKNLLESEEKETTGNTNAPLFSDIKKKLMKLKYQIPSLRKLSWTSPTAQSQTSGGSTVGGSVQELPKLHKSESFKNGSFYKEIEDIFVRLEDKEKFFLSCFAVLTEHAVVKRRLLTYWGLGEGFLSESNSETDEETPEKIVDKILEKLQEMGFIEPAMRKRKQEVRSYKMDPLVRSAMIMICKKKKSDGDSNGNAVEYSALANKAFLVKREEKSLVGESPSQEGEDQSQNLDPEILVTLFNVNKHSPDTQLNNLANKKSKDVKVVDWLSKMKSLKVLYLGRWQKSAGYHIEVKDTAFLKGLKSMEKLKFLSLQGISRINKLPPFISMLKNLVVLDLKDCYNLEVLSEDISSLTNLRYLDISNCYLLGNMPKKLSSLSELQVLKGFVIGDPRRGKLGALEDLKGLKKLKKLTIIATRKDFPTPEDLGALLKLEALRKLTIAWGVQPKNSEEQAKAGELSKHETSLLRKAAESSVHPSDILPNKLEKLDLQCFPYSTPTWLKPGDLPMLEKLYIRGGNFTTLEKGTWKVKALRLKYLSGMKRNWRELKELFPELVYLERVKCPGITLCPCDENGVWQNPKT